jgi:hypothetical protein
MTRKPKSAAPKPASLSTDAKRAAIPRLEARVRELEQLAIEMISSGDDPSVQELSARIHSTLSQIYGGDSLEFDRLQAAADLDLTTYYLNLVGGGSSGPTIGEIRDGLNRGRTRALSLLRGELEMLRESLPKLNESPTVGASMPRETVVYSSDVFIVHGHDTPAKVDLARLIERAGLNAVILHEQPDGGRTIIEKFEAHGGLAGFAVVLLTPDDVGGPDADHLQPRARQNVIGEMFWFAAKLGRDRVCALRKGNVELPSDFAGVIYIAMDEHGAWKAKLLKELANAGYTVDWAKAV